MTRTVFCRKYQQQLPGLERPPYPGAKGQDIFENVSQKAWQEWLAYQTMLINEKQLNLMDAGTRVYLGEQMNNFFAGESVDTVEGYIPPEENK